MIIAVQQLHTHPHYICINMQELVPEDEQQKGKPQEFKKEQIFWFQCLPRNRLASLFGTGCGIHHLIDPDQPHENDHHDKDHLPDVLVKILCILRPEFIYPRHHKKPCYVCAEDERYSCGERKALCLEGRRIDQNEGGEDEHDEYRSTLRRDQPCAVCEVNCVALHCCLKA